MFPLQIRSRGSLEASFAIFAHIFLMSKAMAKKAKSIVTLSFPICRKRRYAMLYFICPNTASGSMHRFPPVLDPFFRSQPFTRLPFILVQPVVHFMMRFLRALKQPPRRGHPSHLCAWYRALSVIYPLAVLPRLVPMRVMCCPMGQT